MCRGLTEATTPITLSSMMSNCASDVQAHRAKRDRDGKPKSVSFHHSHEIVDEVTSSSSMSHEERSDRWYHRSDLNKFKKEAVVLCRSLLMNPTTAMARSYSSSNGTEEEMCLRGYESAISIERQKYKALATKTILKAKDRYRCPEKLAQIAMKLTAYARSVALSTGFTDFYTAHHPAFLAVMPEIPIAPFPLSSFRENNKMPSTSMKCSTKQENHFASKKRNFASVDTASLAALSQGRRVRKRIATHSA